MMAEGKRLQDILRVKAQQFGSDPLKAEVLYGSTGGL